MRVKDLLDKHKGLGGGKKNGSSGMLDSPGKDREPDNPATVREFELRGKGSGKEADGGPRQEGMPEKVNIEVDCSARVSLDLLPEHAVLALRGEYSFENPAWSKAVRYSLHPPEKYLHAYYVDDSNRFCVPRASLRRLVDFMQARKTGVHIVDNTVSVPAAAGFSFTGQAVTEYMKVYWGLYEKRFNVLGATGEPAYLVACMLMAARGEKTLVVVKGRHQLYRWRDQICRFTDLAAKDIGLAGDRNLDLDADVVVGIDRTLYKHLQDLSAGHLIIDRCDAANTKIFYKLCWGVCSRYITGIAKTGQREDGLFEMMQVFCGPVRYTLSSGPEPARRLLEIRSAASGPEPGSGEDDYVSLLDGLCENSDRNRQIAADILVETAEKRRCLVVSARTGHLKTISGLLSEQLRGAEIVTGRTKPGAKRSAEQRFDSGQSLVLMTTTKTVGTLDVGPADLVIVAAPFKYKDTAANIVHLVAGAGRVVEYSDQHPFFKASLKKRMSTYRQLGVQVAQSV